MNTEVVIGVRINNRPPVDGTLTIETQTETIRSNIATEPDLRWEHVDASNHFHAYDQDGELPTLTPRTRHVECDGSCGGVCGGEGYDTTDYFCVICDEQVEPQRVDDHGPHIIPTGKTWTVTAQTNTFLAGDRVTMRLDLSTGRQLFGVASIGEFDGTFGFDRTEVTTTFYGVGPLGIRIVGGAA